MVSPGPDRTMLCPAGTKARISVPITVVKRGGVKDMAPVSDCEMRGDGGHVE